MPTLDFVSVVQSLQGSVMVDGPLWLLVNAVCWLMAGVFLLTSVFQLRTATEDGRGNYKPPIMSFLAAVLMASSPSFIQSVLATTYGEDTWGKAPLSYVVDSTPGKPFGAVLSLVSFMGYCFFVRGIFVLKAAGEPQKSHASVGQAIWILGAGMAAMYIDISLQIIANTLGWNISAYIAG